MIVSAAQLVWALALMLIYPIQYPKAANSNRMHTVSCLSVHACCTLQPLALYVREVVLCRRFLLLSLQLICFLFGQGLLAAISLQTDLFFNNCWFENVFFPLLMTALCFLFPVLFMPLQILL